jgi:hypothetical protein
MSMRLSVLNRSIRPLEHVADARLRDAQEFGGLRLRQASRGDHLLKLDQQVGANQEMLGFVGREPEIAEYVAARRRDLHATFSWHLQLVS